MFRFTLILISAFMYDSAQGIEAPWRYVEIDVEECAARALSALPGGDLVPDWRRENYPRYSLALNSINALLPEDQRLNAEQVDHAVAQLMFGEVDDYLQAVEIYEDDMTDGKTILPEYVDAVRAWLLALAQRPLPTREEIEADRNSYRRVPTPLNPIEQLRKAKLEAKLNEVEARLQQPLFSDREGQLEHSARTSYNTNSLMEDLRAIPGGPRPYSIAEYQIKMSKMRVFLRDHTQGIPYALYQNSFLLQLLDNEKFRKELDFYASQEDLYAYPFVEHRVRGWLAGQEDLHTNIETYLAEELRRIYSVFATGGPGPHYMGELYNYSLYWALQRTKSWERMTRDELLALEEKIRKAELQIQHLGRAWLNGGAVEMYAIEMRLQDETLHFAMQVRPRYAEDLLPGAAWPALQDAGVENLKDVSIVDIRPVYRPARFQDGFKTYPIDLAEPLLKLDQTSVKGAKKEIPTYILISHISPTLAEQNEMTPMETFREVAGQMGAVIFGGQKPMQKPYIELKYLTPDLREILGSKMRLPLIAERTGMQLYQAQQKNLLSRVTVTLKRNVVSGKFTLSIVRENGALGLYMKTGELTADYRELRD